MQITALGLATDLMMLRLGGSSIDDRGDHLVVRTPDNPNYWWGNFVALAEPPPAANVPGWLRTFAEHFPQARHRAFAIDRAGLAAEWIDPWRDLGLVYDAGTALVAEALHEPPRPNHDAIYRPLDTEADWDALVEVRCANNEDLEPASYRTFTVDSVRGVRRLVDAGHGQWFGAFLGSDLVSTMGLFTDGSGVARYQAVDTHPGARRRGLAGTLAHNVGLWGFRELGARQLVILADPHAEAIRVYRSIGFTDAEPAHRLERAPSGERLTPASSAAAAPAVSHADDVRSHSSGADQH
ncbi:MAG: GNAT family N-acetyltransferase [Kineosporiaceae bacterium]